MSNYLGNTMDQISREYFVSREHSSLRCLWVWLSWLTSDFLSSSTCIIIWGRVKGDSFWLSGYAYIFPLCFLFSCMSVRKMARDQAWILRYVLAFASPLAWQILVVFFLHSQVELNNKKLICSSFHSTVCHLSFS